ncbi:helix-turn-helix domain-containing protein [Sphingomonadaceae bacterium OTU29THOMA1]|nr:helix-turn-helix domain-containing protein [Sphingomonadaceae bacterium OTU29THOMA1]
MSRSDAAAYLGLSTKTLAERQRKGLQPASVKVGGRRFYFLQELDRFIGSEA